MSDDAPILEILPQYHDERTKACLAEIEGSHQCPAGCGRMVSRGLDLVCPRCLFRHSRLQAPDTEVDEEERERQRELERQRALFELGLDPSGRPLAR